MATGNNFLAKLKQQGSQQPYKMLLMGKTGSGKTSLLNLLWNCANVQQVNLRFDGEGLKRFKEFNKKEFENALGDAGKSKTSVSKLYKVEMGDLKVGIIDTPGFGDTRGFDQDVKNTETIIAELKGEEYINCVCLVNSGRDSRVDATLRYVLSEITSILPKQVLDNVIVVLTNAGRIYDRNFKPVWLKEFFGRPLDHVFWIDNPYCMYDKLVNEEGYTTEDTADELKDAFERTTKVLTDMCTTMSGFEKVYTHQFTALYDKKQEIEATVIELLTTYDNQMSLEKALKSANEEVAVALKKKTLNKDYKTEPKTIEWIETIKTTSHNTLCTIKDCYSNCHAPCYLPKSWDKEDFKDCRAIIDGGGTNCKQCGHEYFWHYHNEIKFEPRTKTIQHTNKEMEAAFIAAESMEARAKYAYDTLEKQQLASKEKRRIISENLHDAIVEFQKMGVARNYAMLLENQLAVIESRLKGTIGKETEHLRKTKEKLEKELKLVRESLAKR